MARAFFADPDWIRKTAAIRDALRRARPHVRDTVALLRTSSGADLAAMAGTQIASQPTDDQKAQISERIYGGTDKRRYSVDYTQFVLNNRMAEAIIHEFSHNKLNALFELDEVLETDLPDEDWDTLGGLVFNTLGHVPVEGDHIVTHGWRFTVREMEGRRIKQQVRDAFYGDAADWKGAAVFGLGLVAEWAGRTGAGPAGVPFRSISRIRIG